MSKKTSGDQKSLNWYINSVIVLLFVFGFGHLPIIEPLTPVGMQLVGIFIGVIWA